MLSLLVSLALSTLIPEQVSFNTLIYDIILIPSPKFIIVVNVENPRRLGEYLPDRH